MTRKAHPMAGRWRAALLLCGGCCAAAPAWPQVRPTEGVAQKAVEGAARGAPEQTVQQAPQVAPALRGDGPPPPVPAENQGQRGRRTAPVWRLEIVAPEPLDKLLKDYLDIARYSAQVNATSGAAGAGAQAGAQAGEAGRGEAAGGGGGSSAASPSSANAGAAAPGASAAGSPQVTAAPARASDEAPVGVISRGELRRLVAATPDQARSLIEAEGYFASQINVSVSDEEPGEPTVVRLEVDPGPKATVRQVQMIFEGELDTRAEQGDAQAQALVRELNAHWGLPPGQNFRQAGWSAAKNGALAELRAQGYPTATWSGTSATVDAQQLSARLYVVADSGPLFLYGPLRIEGLQRQPASAIENMAPFREGQPYSEGELLDFQERLQKLNLFESVFVSVPDDPAVAKAAPVTVTVRELMLQQATLGVGVSSDTGPRVSLEHTHRLLFGQPWQSKSKVQVGREESLLQTDLTSHPRAEGRRWLASFLASRQVDSEEAVTDSLRVQAGRLYEDERIERKSTLEYQRARVRSDAGELLSDAAAVTGTQQWLWRKLDSPVLPTRGMTANLSASAGRTFSGLQDEGFFGRLYGRLTWYRPLPGNWYGSLRTEAGHVQAASDVSVPETLLFRAGGDESVRGYGYRTLGVQQSGVTLGGRALLTTSLELARPVWPRFPSLWGAVFVDAGDAAKDWSSLRLKAGYGFGVRWRSPVGPLRLDLAYGEHVQEWRVHFSVGITL